MRPRTLSASRWVLALLLFAAAAGRLSLDSARARKIARGLQHRHTERCFRSNHEIVNERHYSCQQGQTLCRSNEGCGRTPAMKAAANSAAYIQNGANVKYGEWPFYVLVKVGDLPNFRSGVLISNRHVLILATSIVLSLPDKLPNVKVTGVFKPKELKVLLGEQDLDKRDAGEQLAAVKEVFIGRKFSLASRKHDWALLELEQPIGNFTDYIQPACVPLNPVRHAGDQSDCYLVGGGKGDGNSKEDRQIQKVRVQQVACPERLAIEDSDESRECYAAWPRERGDICRGDMGAPIFCRDARDRWVLMGLRKGADFEEDFASKCESMANGTALVATKLELLLMDILLAADGK